MQMSLPSSCNSRSGLTSGEHPMVVETIAGAQQEETVITDQDLFLKTIHKSFLRLVQPLQSGFTDELRRDGILSSDEEETLKSTPRRDQARLVWNKPHRVSPRQLEKSVSVLKRFYPHMCPAVTFQWDGREDSCLRHTLVKRLQTPRKLMDAVFSHTDCTQAEYREVTSGRNSRGKRKWDSAFRILKRNSQNMGVKLEMLKLFKKIGVDNPSGLRTQLKGGFSCTCKSSMYLRPRKRKQVDDARNDSATPSSGYPATSSSECSISPRVDDSTSSTEETSSQVPLPVSCQRALVFQDSAIREKYYSALNSVNRALTDVSRVRTACRELETMRSELDYSSKSSPEKLSSMKILAEGTMKTIQEIMDKAGDVSRETEDLLEKTVFDISDLQNGCQLRRRCFLLNSETKEARPFVRKASKVFIAIQTSEGRVQVPKVSGYNTAAQANLKSDVQMDDVTEVSWLQKRKAGSQETICKPSGIFQKAWKSQSS